MDKELDTRRKWIQHYQNLGIYLGLSAMWDLLTPRKWLKAYKNEIQTGSESLNSKPHPSPNSQVVMDLYWRKIVGWALAKNMAVGDENREVVNSSFRLGNPIYL